MAGFEFRELELRGAYLINSFYAGDNRGGFTKTFERDFFRKAGIVLTHWQSPGKYRRISRH